MKLTTLTLLLAALAAGSASLARAQHVHVQLSYPNNQWRLFIYDFEGGESEAGDVPFFVGAGAFSTVPATPAFTNFLGPAGAPVWILPQVEVADILYLGIGTSGIPPGTFANNQVRLELRSLSGPGHFALFAGNAVGAPLVHMNSRDGIDPAADSVALASAGGHIHVNWAFSAPGVYRLGLTGSGRLAANCQTNTSPVVEYTFIVEDVPWRPRLSAPRMLGGTNFVLTMHGGAGRACRIEASTNCVHWQTVTNLSNPTGTMEVELPVEENARRFFRAVTP